MKNKKALKSIVSIILLFGVFTGLFYLMVNSNEEITPVPSEQVEAALIEEDFAIENQISVPKNSQYAEYAKTVSAKKDDIVISFYEFDNDDYANAVYDEFLSEFYHSLYRPGNRIGTEGGKNYFYFVCDGNNRYYALTMWVGNTAICAYCNMGNQAPITNVLSAINYI
ncbi:MAG TPA: hypothetical protein IAD23_04030 [Candidatus Scubalenecus merdavium]|uniref:Uncharacterized protein n=1 Tax=Candidatus Scybalenecus merdavium TaxID=2840939 RepID=A0A9D1MUF7_9FIRM|nr:hypothetical protein [Candidatus Scubalenecus merdavium]